MDIQAIPMSTASQAGAGVSTGNGRAAGASASGDSGFAALLGGQQNELAAGDGTSDGMYPDTQTTSLFGLLQILQTMIAPLQNLQSANAGAAEQRGIQGLPAQLLKAMQGNPEFAGLLLQDPNMQAWLAQASAVLRALAGPGGPATAGLPSGLSDGTKLAAQQTLLQLATLTEQHPGNPIMQHLLNDLQRTVEPLLTKLSAEGSAESLEAAAGAFPQLSSSDGTSEAANIALLLEAARDKAKQRQAQKASQSGEGVIVRQALVETTGAGQLQQTRSKLEMLAAKTSGMTTAMQQGLSEASTTDAGGSQSSSSESSLFQSPAMLQDLLKTLQREGVKPADQATINAQTFVRDMSEFMVKNMKFTLGEAMKEAKLSLNPEHLGRVDVKTTLQADGQLVAKLTADTTAGRLLLESQLPQLRQSLQNQGLQIERLEVAQQADMASSMFQQQRQGQGNGQPFARNNRTRLPELEAADGEFVNDLRTLADIRQHGGSATDPSFDVTA